jgi:molybdopterin-guanine dinucleotide biosynthesis protein A
MLAGGAGSRMGGPKADLVIQGKPILRYLLDRFGWPGPTMLVTAPSRRSPRGCEAFEREVVDPIDGGGPLRGVLSALENLATPIAIVTTVDMPMIRRAHLDWLRDSLARDATLLGLMCRHGEQVEPFQSIYRAAASEVIGDRLHSDQRSTAALSKLPHFASISAPADWDESVWTNLNTPHDFDGFIGGSDTA